MDSHNSMIGPVVFVCLFLLQWKITDFLNLEKFDGQTRSFRLSFLFYDNLYIGFKTTSYFYSIVKIIYIPKYYLQTITLQFLEMLD